MMNTFAERHPYTFSGLMIVAVFAAYNIAGLLLQTHKLGLPAIIIANALLAFLVSWLMTRWGWWRRAGFSAPRHWKDALYFVILLIPVALNIIPSHIAGNPSDLLQLLIIAYGNPAQLSQLVVATLLVGFVEESIFRGLMLQAILPRGVWKAVIVTTLLFGLSHSANLFNGQSATVTAIQISGALAFGFVAAALVVTKGLVWPIVIAHFLTDFTGLPNPAGAGSISGMPVEIGMIILFLAFGFYLLGSLRNHPVQPMLK